MDFKNLAAAALLSSSLALVACGAETDTVTEVAPEGIPGMSVENARLVLPAVSGNPAAVYFDLKYDGDKGLSIRRADVAGAENSQIHTYAVWDGQRQMGEALPIAITKGTEIAFKPGDYHVMVFNLDEGIEAGNSVEVTLTVSGGDKYSFDAEVRAAGDER